MRSRVRWPSLILGLLISVGLAAAAWSYFRDRTWVLRFTEDELRESLEARLPFTRTYLVIFEVTLDEPRIVLEEGSDRIIAGLDVSLDLAGTEGPEMIRGSVDASSALRYEAETGEFFLVDPEIHEVSVPGVPDRYTSRIDDVLSRALAEYYRTRPIHTIRRSDLRYATARLLLEDVRVVDGDLVVTLGL